MARYVVLEFDDNVDADNFVKAVQGDQIFVGVEHKTLPGQYNVVRPTNDFDVVGLYMRPRLACTCRQEGKWTKQDGYTRGLKYGLWVHNGCGKPSSVALESWGSRVGLGRNLLEENPLAEGLRRLDGTMPETAIRDTRF